MALKMGEADKDVCIHDGAANLGFLYVFAAANRNADIVCPFQPIGNDDGTAYGKRSKAVFPGAFQMLQRIFTAARIRVLQSVRNGWPPSPFTTSATAFA